MANRRQVRPLQTRLVSLLNVWRGIFVNPIKQGIAKKDLINL
jgi:hypothetical protein